MSENKVAKENSSKNISLETKTPSFFSKYSKILIPSIIVCAIGLVGAGAYFWQKYITQKKLAENIVSIISSEEYSRKNCSDIYAFDSFAKNLPKDFNIGAYDDFTKQCDVRYDLKYLVLNEESCINLISTNLQNIKKSYLKTEGFEEKRNDCTEKFFTMKFSTGTLFAERNDFKSSVRLSFGQDFFTDLEGVSDEAFIAHRTQEKKRLLSLIQTEPELNISVEDVVLYPKNATLLLNLEPEKEYRFQMKEFPSNIEWKNIESEEFVLKTPKFSYFGLKKNKTVSLFADSDAPSFELISYNDERSWTRVKMCRIPNESYAKVEVLQERDGGKEKEDFFKNNIDALEHFTCFEKDIDFTWKNGIIKKQSFDFNTELGSPARSWLYYMTFVNPDDRVTNGRAFEAEFFGIIDSHITMKLSKNGEAFFFVNDLAGKPLADQELRVYVDDFSSFSKKYDREQKKDIKTYTSVIENEVLGKPILLGTTGKDGVLRVNMKEKADTYFQRSFESYEYDWQGKYNSFFVTSASETNLTYLSSKWNGGIRGWNFGYDVGNGWWYGESENMDSIELNRWEQEEPEYYAHIFPDRKLYLPSEQVHLKAVVRDSRDLNLPVGEVFELTVKSPDGKDFLTENVTLWEFASADYTLNISENDQLGSYQVMLEKDGKVFARSGFNVEIFKNPKFKNEVMLETRGINKELVQNITKKQEQTEWGYERESYNSDFTLSATISSNYYSGPAVKNADFTYKVYKQYYYDTNYWDDCFYGCYWEPEKEFYTEGKGKLDQAGKAQVQIPVKFSSYYNDYKYIVEVTVTDDAGDQISGSNAIVARLPDTYKSWNPESGIYFESQKRFFRAWERFEIEGWLTHGDFSESYNDQFLLIIKKKDYFTRYVQDVRGYKRPITRSEERVQKILPVNTKNFRVKNGKLSYSYTLDEPGEYVLEYGRVNENFFKTPRKWVNATELFWEILSELSTGESSYVDIWKQEFYAFDTTYNVRKFLEKTCVGTKSECLWETMKQEIQCLEKTDGTISDEASPNSKCEKRGGTFSMEQRISVNDLLDTQNKKYFTLIGYGDKSAKNPIESDNKITVLSEKISYKLGETARILVRFPFENGKILWTVEKQGVMEYEYIDVPGNTFFKEIEIDDSFVPNAYVWVVIVDTNLQKIPEYKVGYTEIVVDKTEKKSEITLKTDKESYKPREKVQLDIEVKNARNKKPSELTVMVVDESLIALMGNIDVNILEKMYKKLPFQIQTVITNIAMLKNYYFSRRGIVGGSGFGNFKWGDSAVSSRNIFKNTAYYNANLITDTNGKASVEFELPDNLTNFRIMVVSQSKDNFFGFGEQVIEVRKDVLVEDKTPLVLRVWDAIELGANVMNTTEDKIGFLVSFDAPKLGVKQEKKITLKPGENTFVSWKVENAEDCIGLQSCEIPYTISVLWDSKDWSDKIENTIQIAGVPALTRGDFLSFALKSGEEKQIRYTLPENVVQEKSFFEMSLSNNPLRGMEKIAKSLAVYPFGCGEQLMSSTFPNVILKKFDSLLDTGISENELQKNIDHGISEILKLQLKNGAIAYWPGDIEGNAYISAYALRIFTLMQESGVKLSSEKIEALVNYLLKEFPNLKGLERTEVLWALSEYYGNEVHTKLAIPNLVEWLDVSSLTRHEKIAFVAALVAANKEQYRETIQSQIPQIEAVLDDDTSNSWYYNSTSDTATFVQILIAFGGYDNTVVWYIQELSQKDWESYWYSTRAKNEAFLAFSDYIDRYGPEKKSKILLIQDGRETPIELDGLTLWQVSESYKDIFSKNNSSQLELKHISGDPVVFTSNMKSYAADPYALDIYENKLSLSRKIYEVVDANNITEKCRWNNGNRSCDIPAGLKLVEGNEFKKWRDYKIILEAEFESDASRQNFVFEDYLPAGFLTLNENFKTNSIATSQGTSWKSWEWSYSEKRPEVMMTHAKNIWGRKARYEYFVRAEFAGEFMYPPAVGYLMYDPEVRASGKFRKVVVK